MAVGNIEPINTVEPKTTQLTLGLPAIEPETQEGHITERMRAEFKCLCEYVNNATISDINLFLEALRSIRNKRRHTSLLNKVIPDDFEQTFYAMLGLGKSGIDKELYDNPDTLLPTRITRHRIDTLLKGFSKKREKLRKKSQAYDGDLETDTLRTYFPISSEH